MRLANDPHLRRSTASSTILCNSLLGIAMIPVTVSLRSAYRLHANATPGPTLGAIVGKMPDCPFTSKRGFPSSEATLDARRSRR